MFSAICSAELARARHRELLDQAAHRRMVRHARRARGSSCPRRWGKLARLTGRSAPTTSGLPARSCDALPMTVAGNDGSPPPRVAMNARVSGMPGKAANRMNP
jgi:hypothetical protein